MGDKCRIHPSLTSKSQTNTHFKTLHKYVSFSKNLHTFFSLVGLSIRLLDSKHVGLQGVHEDYQLDNLGGKNPRRSP